MNTGHYSMALEVRLKGMVGQVIFWFILPEKGKTGLEEDWTDTAGHQLVSCSWNQSRDVFYDCKIFSECQPLLGTNWAFLTRGS